MTNSPSIDCCAVGVLQDDLNFKSSIIYKNNIAGIKFNITGEFNIELFHKIKNHIKLNNNIKDFQINLTKKYLFINWDIENPININEFVSSINNFGIKLIADNTEYSKLNYSKNLYLKQIGISFFGMMNVFIISIATWVGKSQEMSDKFLEILHLSNTLIAIPLIIISSRSFFLNSIESIKEKKINIDVSILISIFFTTVISFYNSFQPTQISQTNIYYESVLMLIFILTLGKYFEISTILQNKTDLNQLFNEHNKIAIKIENGKKTTTHHDELQNGDIIEINPNEMVNFDGYLISKQCNIDNSLITGESQIVNINCGEIINKGCINLEYKIQIKITNINNTIFDKINDIIKNSKNFKNKYVLLSQKISKFYTYVIIIAAIIGFVFWILNGKSIHDSLIIGITILIISCPCAISLAIPMVHMNAILNLKQNGIIVKKGDFLEIFTKIKNIIFDKTGVLTKLYANENDIKNLTNNELNILYAISKASRHPYSKSIIAMIEKLQLKTQNIEFEEIQNLNGNGILAIFEDQKYILGNKIAVNINTKQSTDKNVIFFKTNDNVYKLNFKEIISPETFKVFDYFKKNNIKCHILSGDTKNSVISVANQIKPYSYQYEMNPMDKKDYLNKYKSTCMVGDGINDTASLAYADVSISPGSSFDINIINSDIIYKNNNPMSIVGVHIISKFANNVSVQNLVFSIVYNAITIPIAFMGNLTPLYAALLMSASSVIVVLNSIRLRYKKWTY